MYAFLSMLMDGPASLATSFIGLKIAPHFDKPYLTCSLTDFWSRRWNLTAGNTLRFLVPLLPTPWRPACKLAGGAQNARLCAPWQTLAAWPAKAPGQDAGAAICGRYCLCLGFSARHTLQFLLLCTCCGATLTKGDGVLLSMQIYDPIMEQRLVKDREAFVHRTRFGRQIGIAASFVVSGIVHELILR